MTANATNEQLNIESVMALLPHRYPFLLVDRVLTYRVGESLLALKNVTMNEPFFQGHFPGQPMMPGVLVLEAMAQASGLLGFLTIGEDKVRSTSYVLVGVNRFRMRRPVVPGDQLQIDVALAHRKQGLWKFTCEASVDAVPAAQGEILVAENPDLSESPYA